MTKEELEKEAEEFAFAHWADTDEKGNYFADDVIIKQTYINSAEPREKQIQIDAEQIRALQKQNGELADELTKKSDTNHQLIEQMAELNERCSELEAQIEKMKSDVLNLIKGRMNEDIDQNLIERMADKWGLKYE